MNPTRGEPGCAAWTFVARRGRGVQQSETAFHGIAIPLISGALPGDTRPAKRLSERTIFSERACTFSGSCASLWAMGRSLIRVSRRALLGALCVLTAGRFARLAAQERFVAPGSGVERAQAVATHRGMVVSQDRLATEVGVGHSARRRQRGRCRRRGRFRPRRHAAQGRQYRRRRLHAGASRRAQRRRLRSTIARPRRPRPRRRYSSTTTARPIRANRATQRLAVGVPGTVAGLALAHERFGSGKFTLAELIAPAIALARDGVPIEDDLLDSLLLAQPRLRAGPRQRRIFLKPDGSPLGGRRPSGAAGSRRLAGGDRARGAARLLHRSDRRRDRRGGARGRRAS